MIGLLDREGGEQQEEREEARVCVVELVYTYFLSFASHTVEKWPQPSFLTTMYLLSEKESPSFTG